MSSLVLSESLLRCSWKVVRGFAPTEPTAPQSSMEEKSQNTSNGSFRRIMRRRRVWASGDAFRVRRYDSNKVLLEHLRLDTSSTAHSQHWGIHRRCEWRDCGGGPKSSDSGNPALRACGPLDDVKLWAHE